MPAHAWEYFYNPLSLDGITRVGKCPISYELQSIDPLSLRERARVRVILSTNQIQSSRVINILP